MASTGNNDLPILKVWWSHDISEINFGGISRAKKVHCVYSVAMNEAQLTQKALSNQKRCFLFVNAANPHYQLELDEKSALGKFSPSPRKFAEQFYV